MQQIRTERVSELKQMESTDTFINVILDNFRLFSSLVKSRDQYLNSLAKNVLGNIEMVFVEREDVFALCKSYLAGITH